MTSYNLVNGVHTFASADLCTKVLRNEWGYQGLVMTDWTASEKIRVNMLSAFWQEMI